MRVMPPDTAAQPNTSAAGTSPASPTKPWWHSRTLWFNLVCAIVGAAELGMGLLQPMLHVNVYAVLAFALSVGNAALRAITSQGLTRTTTAPEA